MDIAPPKNLEVISMSSYEYVHFESSDGRVFLSVAHESGFTSFSTRIELNPEEIHELKHNKDTFIKNMLSKFSHSTQKFSFQDERGIKDFSNWAAVKEALNKWHGR